MTTQVTHYLLTAGKSACKLVYQGTCPFEWTRNRSRVTCPQCRAALGGKA